METLSISPVINDQLNSPVVSEMASANSTEADALIQPSQGDQNWPVGPFYLRSLTEQGKDQDADYSSLHAALRAFLMTPYAKRPRVLANNQLMASYMSDAGTIPWFKDEHVEAAYLNAFASAEHQLATRQVHQISKLLLPNLSKSNEAVMDAYDKAAPELKTLLGNQIRMAELSGLLSKQSGIDPVDLKRVQALLGQHAGATPLPAPSPTESISTKLAPFSPSIASLDQAPLENSLAAPPEFPVRPVGNGFRPAGPLPKERLAPASVAGILERITHKTKSDGSVEYSLDGKPVFIDHGDQILMVGAADHDEQAIIAALLVAKEKYGGAFELTGDIEFQKRTIDIMIRYNIDAMLKSPEQDAMRRDLLKAAQDAPAQSPRAATPASPVMPIDLKRLISPLTPADAAPVPMMPPASLDPGEPAAPPITTAPNVALAEPINRLAGTVLRFGVDHYQHKPRQKISYFIELENADGQTRTTWGVDLERVAREQNLAIGDTVVLQNLGRKPVEVRQHLFDKDGNVVGSEIIASHRNAWEIEFVKRAVPSEKPSETNQQENADTAPVQSAPAISFVDASAWWANQRDIIQNFSIDYAEMQGELERLGPKPSAGQVYWFDGGRPSAPPPDAAHILDQYSHVTNQADTAQAKPALVAYATRTLPTGHFVPSVLLFKSATDDYLQGVINIGEQKQHVIAQIVDGPAAIGGQAIVLSKLTMTPDRPNWQAMGHGSAINRSSNGEQVYFDELHFVIGDATLVARVNHQLDHTLRQKIGFERPQRERPEDKIASTPIATTPKQAANVKENGITPAPRKPQRQRSASPRA